MNCADFEIRLADYLDNTLGIAERVALEEHADTCVACGQLLEDASAGLKVTHWADEVTPPPDLLTRIAFQAPVGRLRHAWERQGLWAKFISPYLHPLLQPRLAMGMAMTILSFAMLERCTGVKVQHIQAADLSPIRIWGGVEDKAMRVKDRAVKYYENLRWVYEIEVRLGSLQQQAADNPAVDSSQPGKQTSPKNQKPGEPVQPTQKEDKR